MTFRRPEMFRYSTHSLVEDGARLVLAALRLLEEGTISTELSHFLIFFLIFSFGLTIQL